jgi:molybdopterin-containing oxidoreductase family iron-sulfur binding subunit
MNRRTFLKIAGMGSISIAAGCASETEKTLYSLVKAPNDLVAGKASWYASTCRECPAGCGILAKNREGRVIKVEGNLLHPINRGKLCIRGQATLQGIYNPDRIKTPLLKTKEGWKSISFPEAESLLQRKAQEASKAGRSRIRMLTEVVGEHLLKLFSESLQQWGSKGPVIFEPFAYESLKTANEKVYGVKGLVSYRMEKADFLLSFGADFLETWLSTKGLFFHVSPYQSLTCANADQWLACNPDSEAAIVLGLLRESLKLGRSSGLPRKIRYKLENAASPYTKKKVAQLADVSVNLYEKLATRLIRAKKPLILGTGTGGTGPNALQTNIAVNYLNRILDRQLSLIDFDGTHRVELAVGRSKILNFIDALGKDPVDLLLLNNVNPVFALPPSSGIEKALRQDSLYVVSFSNFMDETTQLADLILPVSLPLETWEEYSGKKGIVSTLQPTMGSLTGAPHLGDVFLRAAFGDGGSIDNYKTFIVSGLIAKNSIKDEIDWARVIQKGGIYKPLEKKKKQKTSKSKKQPADTPGRFMVKLSEPLTSGLTLIVAPSIRFFDGRGANRSWLCEVPDPLTKVAWQTTLWMHPDSLRNDSLVQGDVVQIKTQWGQLEAAIYETNGVKPGVLVMSMGQGHVAFGRYAQNMGVNPIRILNPGLDSDSGAAQLVVDGVVIRKTGRFLKLAHTDGSRLQHGRKIALSTNLEEIDRKAIATKGGLGMHEFPITLPLPEGYNLKRDFYPTHEHENYRWGMGVDLDKCIGCGACAVACYAENNLGVVRLERMIEGREMSWLRVERYLDPLNQQKTIFLPLLCQHCDNAPCESVCPVYAPHHSKEGLNNQIYNRCIGTRFCSQNCPYKVRRFNWFDWKWPTPLNLQLNPNVTVRSKGVMEKCSFCIQRIKEARGIAKDENRMIRDGEVTPACVQTCPTGVFTFGNLMDKESRVRKLVDDRRAYQVLGYLNTKPAVIYLKKVVQEV